MAHSYVYNTPCYRSLFSISSVNFNLELNHVPGIKFAESFTAGGKWVYEQYVQKNLPIFFFPFDLSLLNVKMTRAKN